MMRDTLQKTLALSITPLVMIAFAPSAQAADEQETERLGEIRRLLAQAQADVGSQDFEAALGSANRVLAHYGLSLSDWPAGNAYVLRSRTGRTAMVTHLGELWAAAERLAGKPCDPLDGALLEHLAPAPAGERRPAT